MTPSMIGFALIGIAALYFIAMIVEKANRRFVGKNPTMNAGDSIVINGLLAAGLFFLGWHFTAMVFVVFFVFSLLRGIATHL